MSELIKQLDKYIQAGFSGIQITTSEPFEAQREILNTGEYDVAIWDIAEGITLAHKKFQKQEGSNNPIAPLKFFKTTDEDRIRIVLLHNFHRFLDNPVIIQTLINSLQAGKSCQIFYIILTPSFNLPVELERMFVTIDHNLPTKEQLLSLANELKPSKISDQSIEAAQGLTTLEAEGSFALSMIENGNEIVADSVWSIKSNLLKKSKALSIYRGKETFSSIGGLDNLKNFSKKLLRSEEAKGIMLLGVSGAGKSSFVKCLGNEVGRPVIIFDIGALYNKHVGETEHQVREVLKTIDSFGPCIIMFDEIEKMLSGINSDGDSGVSARLFGTFLTWLNDKPSNSFTVATSNNVSCLPETLTRAERFDATFFLDLPTEEEREKIWNLYTKEDHRKVDDEGWTGSEIKSCCRLSNLMQVSLEEAAEYVIPVSISSANKISSLQDWAVDKVLSASYSGVYKKEKTIAKRRKINV